MAEDDKRLGDAVPEADKPSAEPREGAAAPWAVSAADTTTAEAEAPFAPRPEEPAAEEFAEAKPAPPVVTEADPPPPSPRRKQGAGGFFLPLLGGALAAAGGFALSHYDLLQLRADPSLTEARFEQTEAGLSAASASAEAAKADAARLAQSLQELETVTRQAETGMSSTAERITALEENLAALAQVSPDGAVSAAAFAALQAEVAALKSSPAAAPEGLDPEALRAEISAELDARAAQLTAAAEAEAAAIREAAQAEASLLALGDALRSGQPYEAALAALGRSDVPEALSAHAAHGIKTLAQLTESFPDAARAALAASLQAGEGASLSERAWAALRIGTGARALTPKEGSDPDAVLSRAEAALLAGDLAFALREIEALPPAGQAVLADWRAGAEARLTAEAALVSLAPEKAE